MASTNGSPVTNRQLNDKIELMRAEQRVEHVKTRVVTPVLTLVAVATGKAVSPHVIAMFVVWWPF